MMNKRSLYGYFSIKANRDLFLKKIEDKENIEKRRNVKLDDKEDNISKDVLTNWRNKTSKERLSYCEMIITNAKNNRDSLKVVAEKKTQIDNVMANTKDSLKGKIKKIVKEIEKD